MSCFVYPLEADVTVPGLYIELVLFFVKIRGVPVVKAPDAGGSLLNVAGFGIVLNELCLCLEPVGNYGVCGIVENPDIFKLAGIILIKILKYRARVAGIAFSAKARKYYFIPFNGKRHAERFKQKIAASLKKSSHKNKQGVDFSSENRKQNNIPPFRVIIAYN